MGIVIGVGSNYIPWHASETIKVFGLPFPIGFWVLENGKWFDYVSSSIIPLMVLNCALIAFVPQAAIGYYIFIRERYVH